MTSEFGMRNGKMHSSLYSKSTPLSNSENCLGSRNIKQMEVHGESIFYLDNTRTFRLGGGIQDIADNVTRFEVSGNRIIYLNEIELFEKIGVVGIAFRQVYDYTDKFQIVGDSIGYINTS